MEGVGGKEAGSPRTPVHAVHCTTAESAVHVENY